MLTPDLVKCVMEGKSKDVLRLKFDAIRMTLRNRAGGGYELHMSLVLNGQPVSTHVAPWIEVDEGVTLASIEGYAPFSVEV